MSEDKTPKPTNITLEFFTALGEIIVGVVGAILEWAWQTWKDFWFGILVAVLVLFVLYIITKPGWDEVAAGRSFWLSTFESRNRTVQECLKSDLYSREECIQLAGGTKSK